MKNERVQIGQITTAHGIKGLVKIRCDAEDETLLEGGVYTSESGSETIRIQLKNPMKTVWLAEVEGITDRNAAEGLRGTNLYINRDALPDLSEGEFYYIDLIGRLVLDEDNKTLGTLVAVENFGASDLFEIKPPTGASFYLPYTDECVIEIREDAVIARIPDGLL